MPPINVYEHGRLLIGEKGFTRHHWKSFVKLNTLHDDKYFKVLHNGLKFKHYVGVIQVKGLLVQIHPKADKDQDDDNWQEVLLEMLKACGKVKANATDNAKLKKQQINLLEVYFDYFLRELEILMRQGLVKKYRKNTSNVSALKGKLDFAGQIRENLIHQERFYTTHQVYDRDHLLHQIIWYALSIISQLSSGTNLKDRCRRVELAFPEITEQIPTNQQLISFKLDRKTAPYSRVFELAKFIILNYSPDINHGDERMIALLFNMNELWEAYVVKKLKEYTSKDTESNWKVESQSSKLFYGSTRSIRPDIVLRNETETIVIDTKWKRPYNKKASIADLRQMYTYGRFWKAKKLVLLYPGSKYDSGFEEYPNQNDEETHTCKIARVSVLDGKKLDTAMAKNIINLIE